jgi:hypothetical protein
MNLVYQDQQKAGVKVIINKTSLAASPEAAIPTNRSGLWHQNIPTYFGHIGHSKIFRMDRDAISSRTLVQCQIQLNGTSLSWEIPAKLHSIITRHQSVITSLIDELDGVAALAPAMSIRSRSYFWTAVWIPIAHRHYDPMYVSMLSSNTCCFSDMILSEG